MLTATVMFSLLPDDLVAIQSVIMIGVATLIAAFLLVISTVTEMTDGERSVALMVSTEALLVTLFVGISEFGPYASLSFTVQVIIIGTALLIIGSVRKAPDAIMAGALVVCAGLIGYFILDRGMAYEPVAVPCVTILLWATLRIIRIEPRMGTLSPASVPLLAATPTSIAILTELSHTNPDGFAASQIIFVASMLVLSLFLGWYARGGMTMVSSYVLILAFVWIAQTLDRLSISSVLLLTGLTLVTFWILSVVALDENLLSPYNAKYIWLAPTTLIASLTTIFKGASILEALTLSVLLSALIWRGDLKPLQTRIAVSGLVTIIVTTGIRSLPWETKQDDISLIGIATSVGVATLLAVISYLVPKSRGVITASIWVIVFSAINSVFYLGDSNSLLMVASGASLLVLSLILVVHDSRHWRPALTSGVALMWVGIINPLAPSATTVEQITIPTALAAFIVLLAHRGTRSTLFYLGLPVFILLVIPSIISLMTEDPTRVFIYLGLAVATLLLGVATKLSGLIWPSGISIIIISMGYLYSSINKIPVWIPLGLFGVALLFIGLRMDNIRRLRNDADLWMDSLR